VSSRAQREICQYISDMTLTLAQLAAKQDLHFLAEMLACAFAEADDVARGKEPSPVPLLRQPEGLDSRH
jgi:hypothetical protein